MFTWNGKGGSRGHGSLWLAGHTSSPGVSSHCITLAFVGTKWERKSSERERA